MKRREFFGATATLFLFHSLGSAAEGMRRVATFRLADQITDDSPLPVRSSVAQRLGSIREVQFQFERRAANGEVSRLPSLVMNLLPKASGNFDIRLPAIAACKGAPVPAIRPAQAT